jgi:hypothetical protein
MNDSASAAFVARMEAAALADLIGAARKESELSDQTMSVAAGMILARLEIIGGALEAACGDEAPGLKAVAG